MRLTFILWLGVKLVIDVDTLLGIDIKFVDEVMELVSIIKVSSFFRV